MFRSLKEKLKSFRKKASEELKEGEVTDETKAKPGASDNTSIEKQIKDREELAIKPTKGQESSKDTRIDKQKNGIKKKPDKIGKKQISRKKIERKRSRSGGKQISLKRQIEMDTSEQELWEKKEKKAVIEESESSWFSKTISDGKLDSILWELEIGLLESDVALPVVEKVKTSLKEELSGKKIKRGAELDELIEDALKTAIVNVLQTEVIHFDKFIKDNKKPIKLMFVGVNGTGKTSAIAKIAFRLKKQSISSVISASDTFRAGAIEQLEKHANKLGIKLIKDKAGSDPAAIAFDSIEHAKARHKEVVLIDTAGRMQTNTNLMDEMRKIKRVSKPDMIIFVGDSLAGNDVVEQAIQFDKVVGIDAAILTKLDADAKGGAALSIAYAVGKPILFFSVGQRYGDLVPFNPEWLVDRIFE